ncbi:MAG: hypothetical protein PVH52_04685, partial [bacterium]
CLIGVTVTCLIAVIMTFIGRCIVLIVIIVAVVISLIAVIMTFMVIVHGRGLRHYVVVVHIGIPATTSRGKGPDRDSDHRQQL